MTYYNWGSFIPFAFITSAFVGSSSVVWANLDSKFAIHVPILANTCKALMFRVGGSLADYVLEIKTTSGSCPPSSLR